MLQKETRSNYGEYQEWGREIIRICKRNKRRKLFRGRRRERPRLRWMDDVVADFRVMKIKQWTKKTKDREQRGLVVVEAEAHPGL
jgi:hypothetical protein